MWKTKAKVTFLLLFAAVQIQAQPNEQVERIAGFTRLYGVVRYFHPSDTAQEIDWNRFVVFSLHELQKVKTSSEYQKTLLKLFEPITRGMIIQDSNSKAPVVTTEKQNHEGILVAWQHSGPGMHKVVAGGYMSQRTNRPAQKTPISGAAALGQSVDATAYRGKIVRLTALVRVESSTDQAGAALILRIDRPTGMGFFDNMNDRLIRDSQWREYTIEGPVAEDAVSIFIGVKAQDGGVTAGFDNVRLSVNNGDGKWQPIPLKDPGFETGEGWNPTGPATQYADIDKKDTEPPEGKYWVKIALPAEFSPKPVDLGPAKWSMPVIVPLTSELTASVPIVLDDASAKITSQQSVTLASLKKDMEQTSMARDPLTTIADVVVSWAVLRHFYPYWNEANVNWDERLMPLLELAWNDNGTCESHANVLRKLLFEIKDGHARLYDQNVSEALIPITARLIEGQIVVVASSTKEVSVGDVIQTINGQSAMEWFSEKRDLVSGSDAWRDFRTLDTFLGGGPEGTIVRLTIETKDGTGKNVELSYTERNPVYESRPDEITELQPGLWYVDLQRATKEAFEPKLSDLAHAKGVVFDVRGYPNDAAVDLLRHLIDAPEHDRWMHVPHYFTPGGLAAGWSDEGWDLEPAAPAITRNRVFLTEGRAISYAESIMGYIKDKKLATIIGSTTAGTNGDVAMVELPSGFRFWFTGLKVTHHDGTSKFHLLGVEPDEIVKQTVAGVRAGRDEVLEAAVEYLKGDDSKNR